MQSVAELLGDTVEIIRKCYGHLRTDHIDAEIEKIKIEDVIRLGRCVPTNFLSDLMNNNELIFLPDFPPNLA
jgi:hypothetical protein